jgi:hypothetical protein
MRRGQGFSGDGSRALHASRNQPALGFCLVLRPSAIVSLLLDADVQAGGQAVDDPPRGQTDRRRDVRGRRRRHPQRFRPTQAAIGVRRFEGRDQRPPLRPMPASRLGGAGDARSASCAVAVASTDVFLHAPEASREVWLWQFPCRYRALSPRGRPTSERTTSPAPEPCSDLGRRCRWRRCSRSSPMSRARRRWRRRCRSS